MNCARSACKNPSCCSHIISQTSSVVTKCSHIIKVHHWDPPETITWENILSAFALYLPGAGIEVCLCYREAVAKETYVSQTSSIPSYFEHLLLLHRVLSDKACLHAKLCIQKLLRFLFGGGHHLGKHNPDASMSDD